MAARVACFWRALCYADCDASGIGVGGRQSWRGDRYCGRAAEPEADCTARRKQWKP